MSHLSHHDELNAIRRLWRQDNHPTQLEQAKERLVQLRQEFSYVLAVGHELVLVLEKLGDVDGAIRVLGQLERQFKKLDEETLCRWGKVFKKRGEQALSPRGDRLQAIHDFEQAGRHYSRAFEVQRGFYPRINELACQFLRAALHKELGEDDKARQLADDVRRQAQHLLANPAGVPPSKDDDHIWLPATRGEAHLLANDWHHAHDRYRDAIAAARGQQFYLDCMRDQVRLLLDACSRLGGLPEGPLTDPETFFSNANLAVKESQK